MNVHRKRVTSKDTKAAAREEEPLLLYNKFVVVGYNYRRHISYKVPNRVGKMTTPAYIKILEQLAKNLQGITLYQDKDSAHNSKGVKNWAKKHNILLLTAPGNSPDFSIAKSLARTVKKKFHSKRFTTLKQAKARFSQV